MSLYLNYSHSHRILDGHSKEEANKVVDGYKQNTIDWDETPIKELLTKKSIAPAIFKTGRRVLKDVMGYQFIMLDFDDPLGMPAQSMIDLLKSKYPDTAFAVFSSSRHQLQYTSKDTGQIMCHDKYRVLFPLGNSLTKSEIDHVSTYFFNQYPKLDGSCFMPARYFYRGTDQVWYFNPGTKYLDTNEIITETITLKKSKNLRDHIRLDTVVIAANGSEMTIGEITQKTTVHCPFHEDNTPSAFVGPTMNGSMMLFCSTCQSKNLGTNYNGSYYLEHPRIIPQNTTLFFWESAHCAGYVDSRGEIRTVHTGMDWKNFCSNNHVDAESLESLHRGDFTYDPTKGYGFTDDPYWFNLYKPSKYIQEYPNKIPMDLAKLRKIAPTIYTVLDNICGTKDKIKYMLNWFGYLLQTNRQIDTALLIQSKAQGVGKDLLFTKVWTPIFGEKNSVDEEGSAIGERFTAQYSRARLVRFNECFATRDYTKNQSRLQWLKNRITAKTHVIEAKGQDKVTVPHYCAYLLHSNENASFSIEQEDRRFVVITNDKAKPVKAFSWYKSQDDLEERVARELPAFAEYIQSIEISPELANNAIETAAKTRIQEANKDELQSFAEAMRDRDVDYFELEDAIKLSKIDPLLYKDTIEIITYMIEKHQAVPTSFINALIQQKVQHLTVGHAKKYLATYNVVHRIHNKDIKIHVNGKSYRAYKYSQVTDEHDPETAFTDDANTTDTTTTTNAI